jgi:16S rRNA (cytosine967-C5)-methyltransferase
MRDSGRLSAAIEVLSDFERRRVPLKIALADWARGARYAGARDRAWISGLCLDVLRRRRSLAAAMADVSARSAAFAALRWLWNFSAEDVAALAGEAPHGPGALNDVERVRLAGEPDEDPVRASRQPQPGESRDPESAETKAASPASPTGRVPAFAGMSGVRDWAPVSVQGDFPEWLEPNVARVFEECAIREMRALAARADVDLRINTLKVSPEKALEALSVVGAAPSPLWKTAARIPAPAPSEKTPDVTVIPAFNKGWVEVQDLGSQIAAAAAGSIKGAQVLDYCAGGGGKTLALAALMDNTGQLYAYDSDARRLKPVYERAKRAGIRNLQIVNPLTDDAALQSLKAKMDVVFVDAPCTGSGVWRRHPDSKWRLTPEQLQRRMEEQDATLREAAPFVKQGGRLVYVTCSIFMEENEDRLAAFSAAHPGWASIDVLAEIGAGGLLTAEGAAALEKCRAADGALRLTPASLRADGFFIAALRKAPGG